jgi:hypothetical protein
MRRRFALQMQMAVKQSALWARFALWH